MRSLVSVIVLLIFGLVAVGFYRGWFQASANRDRSGQKFNTTFTVDERKLQEDKEKLEGAVERMKDQAAEASGVSR
jgi:hypothetical protein